MLFLLPTNLYVVRQSSAKNGACIDCGESVFRIKTRRKNIMVILSAEKGKGPVGLLDIALLHDEHMLRSALQSRKWQLIGMS